MRLDLLGVVLFVLYLCVHCIAGNYSFNINDPSVENPHRSPQVDDRPGVFDMDARQALKAIEEVYNGSIDCKTMLAKRNMKLLGIKYKNSVFTDQANVGIRSANLVSDLLPTGSLKSLNFTEGMVLRTQSEVLDAIVRNNLENDPLIVGSALIFDNNSYTNNSFYARYAYRNPEDTFIKVRDFSQNLNYVQEAFVKLIREKSFNREFPTRSTYFFLESKGNKRIKLKHPFVESIDGLWSRPYFECSILKAWVITYASPILGNWDKTGNISFMGMSTIDIALTNVDINQCDKSPEGTFQFEIFAGTHHCKNETTQCEFVSGFGFRAGSYKCVCKPGYYFPNVTAHAKYFNGSVIEGEAAGKQNSYYLNPGSFQCLKCQPGCDTCVDSSPCIVTLNWPLRKALMGLSAFSILAAFGIMVFVIFFRELKVVKIASPQFLVLVLSGCILQYCEIIIIYPEPRDNFCITRLWFRHIGFGLGFSSLLLKTWRISVIYRVKSAQKISLTDRQLLQRLASILALYVVYLLAWSLAKPSHVIDMKMIGDVTFNDCSIDWWDHAILIFEMLFLFWGIYVCYNVRKAPSAFNESRFVSWSIYNLTVVTLLFKVTRIFIGDLAGPDFLYLLEFFRVQLSVSVLLGLVFVPKIVRVSKGRGDTFDTRGRVASTKGAALGMPSAGTTQGTVNLSLENEELREEIRKLYGQLQQLKTSNMEAGNRHLGRSSSVLIGSSMPSLLSFSTPNDNESAGYLVSPPGKEKRLQRFSPAAELASDFI
ncbi:probable G-protein coupled receptor CG31760 [Montipora capricornis]|uniref:probable G-protein coupled receptor CG31760 n=1 Tax=Montipora capricornis TaxID=246305 RepID=UPI0035F10023